jgi:hypothetical protein
MTPDPTTGAVEPLPVTPPARIFLTDGREFFVEEIDGWSYIPQGVFARGQFRNTETGEYEQHKDVIFSTRAIYCIECDLNALNHHLTNQEASA